MTKGDNNKKWKGQKKIMSETAAGVNDRPQAAAAGCLAGWSADVRACKIHMPEDQVPLS